MRSYSPFRISAFVLVVGWVPLVLTGLPQLADQDFDLGAVVWGCVVFATLGPLVLTNVLWFTAIHRVGPSRATLVTNLQPFLAAVFALLILSESMTVVQVAGGALIGLGIVLARRRAGSVPQSE
jgi:drug/metabolite transporter (DMT)-like permease